jgi:hypothetical protein
VPTPAEHIDDMIAACTDWRGPAFARLRALVHDADPDIEETWKWVRPTSPGTPVWEHDGIVCFGHILKGRVRITFYEGAHLPDPRGLYNAMLKGNKARAIDLYEDDEWDEEGIKDLVRQGAARRIARSDGT